MTGLVALRLAARQGKAQGTYTGKFTLPFEARWGTAVPSPGDYTISMDLESANNFNHLIVRGEGKSAMLLAAETESKAVSNHSQLTVVKTDEGYAVQTLDAGAAGLTLNYLVPKNKGEGAPQKFESELRLPVSTIRE